MAESFAAWVAPSGETEGSGRPDPEATAAVAREALSFADSFAAGAATEDGLLDSLPEEAVSLVAAGEAVADGEAPAPPELVLESAVAPALALLLPLLSEETAGASASASSSSSSSPSPSPSTSGSPDSDLRFSACFCLAACFFFRRLAFLLCRQRVRRGGRIRVEG